MKSVTKLAHRAATPKEGGAHADEMGAAGDGGPVATQLAQHSAQIGQLQEMHALILKQVRAAAGPRSPNRASARASSLAARLTPRPPARRAPPCRVASRSCKT
jgi:hypothetical protein